MKILAAALLLLIPVSRATAAMIGSWHADLGNGFEAALSLNAVNPDGIRSGNLFWMFRERDISWTETENGYEVTFLRPWSEDRGLGQSAIFLRDGDSLKLDVTKLTAVEKEALGKTPWKPGGKSPGELGSFRVKDSPYSRFHEKGDFVFDVNGAPMAITRYGLRVFEDDVSLYSKLVLHKGFSPETLAGIHAFALSVEASGNSEGGCGTILSSLAKNPSTPREILKKMWSRPPRFWEGLLPYLLSIHPNAAPEWTDAVTALIKDKEKGIFLRSSLASYEPLPAEAVDLLIQASELDSMGLTSLAYRKNLTPVQMTRMMTMHPWTLGEGLIGRPDLPIDAWKAALIPDSWELLFGIMKNPAAPLSVAREAIAKIIGAEKYHHVTSFCAGLSLVAGHPALNEDQQRKLVSHPALEVRSALAMNPSLAADLLEELAEDPYSIVAAEARRRLGTKKESWISLTDLSQATTTYAAFNEACGKDDVEDVLKHARTLMTLPSHGSPSDEAALSNGAMRSIRAMVDAGIWSKSSLAARAGTSIWTDAMSDFVLSGEPAEDVITAFAGSVAKNGKQEDLEPLAKRGIRLAGIQKEALVWFAVARRDVGLIRAFKDLGAPLEMSFDGISPAQLAVRTKFTDAIGLLPMDEKANAELDTFRARFPGDTKAPWLGIWTNGLGEFNTLVLELNAVGTGRLVGAVGQSVMVAWKRSDGDNFKLHAFDERGIEQEHTFEAVYSKEKITLTLADRKETFERAGNDE